MVRSNEENEEIGQRNTLAQYLHNRDAAKRALTRYRRTLASLVFLIFVGLNNIFWGYYTYPDIDPTKVLRSTDTITRVETVEPIMTGDGLAVGLLVTGYLLAFGALLGTLAYVIRNWSDDLVEDVHDAQLRYEQQLNRM